jgi:hypothetical protein
MIRAKKPESVKRANEILQLLMTRAAKNSEIGAALGISSALAAQYTFYLKSQGRIHLRETLHEGGRTTHIWEAVNAAPMIPFAWRPKKPSTVARKRPAHTLTTWVGGNPYERLAA